MLHDPKWDEAKVQPKLDAIGEHLLRAADYIEEHGWCQGGLFNMKGNVCIERALSMTINKEMTLSASFSKLIINLKVRPATWNDHFASSKEEVIAKLREIAYK